MNPYTGELRSFRRDDGPPEGYEKVPRGLESKEARVRLLLAAICGMTEAGSPVARVDLRRGSPLAKWAKKKRKAKAAAASRRRNRK